MNQTADIELTDLYKKSRFPLYLQVANLMRRRILAGHWAANQRIPSLDLLAQEFSVARLTARQSVEHLTSEGLLWSKQGKGTFVIETETSERWLSMQTKWCQLVKMVEGTSLELLREKEGVKCPDLGTMEGDNAGLYHLMERTHIKDGAPYSLIEIYLDDDTFKLDPEGFRNRAVVSVLDTLPGVKLGTGRQTLTDATSDAYTSNCLNIPLESPVANLRRVVLNDAGKVIYLGDIIYRADHVKLDINLDIS